MAQTRSGLRAVPGSAQLRQRFPPALMADRGSGDHQKTDHQVHSGERAEADRSRCSAGRLGLRASLCSEDGQMTHQAQTGGHAEAVSADFLD